ncbi:MAG: hypothetical protein R2693_03070 [Nocardioidaceae bacterium]
MRLPLRALLTTMVGLLTTLLMTLGLITIGQSPAFAAGPYIPDPQRPIHPGTQVVTPFTVCTTNFVFTDDTGALYLGYTAHCNPKEDNQTSLNGCLMNPAPLGDRADFVVDKSANDSGTVVGSGTIVYSSWLAMHGEGQTDQTLCNNNDFALIKVDESDRAKVDPTVPHWGGPNTTEASGFPGWFQLMYGYLNSQYRTGNDASKPTTAMMFWPAPWNAFIYSFNFGIEHDSGAGYMDRSGRPVGTLTSLNFWPPLSNTLVSLKQSIDYARSHGMPGLRIVKGEQAFAIPSS